MNNTQFKKGYKHTEEQKQRQSQKMKEAWARKKAMEKDKEEELSKLFEAKPEDAKPQLSQKLFKQWIIGFLAEECVLITKERAVMIAQEIMSVAAQHGLLKELI